MPRIEPPSQAYAVPMGESPLPSEPIVPVDAPPSTAQAGPSGGLVAAIPKAIAYYLAAVPVLLFKPVGTVKRGIAAPRFGAFASQELIAYAVPPYLVMLVLPGLAAIIYAAVRGGFSIAVVISPLISAS